MTSECAKVEPAKPMASGVRRKKVLPNELQEKDGLVWFYTLHIAYFIVLALINGYYVAPTSGYMGFASDLNAMNLAISCAVLLAFVTLTPREFGVRSFFLNLAILVQITPSLVLFSGGAIPLESASMVWMAFGVVYVVSKLPLPPLSFPLVDSRLLLYGLGVATGALIVALYFLQGLSSFNLNMFLVYDFRRSALDGSPEIIGYLVAIFAIVVIPLSMVLSLHFRNYVATAVTLVFSVLIFGFSSVKSVVVYPAVAMAVFFLLSVSKKNSNIIVALMCALAVAFIDAVMYFQADAPSLFGLFADLLVRRALLLPALLDHYHIEFFTDNPQYFWSTSRLGFASQVDPYGVPPGYVIGREYFGGFDANANAGFVGTGYAHAGAMGVFIYSAGVGLVLAILETFGRNFGRPLVVAIMTVQVITMFTAADLVIMFLTHGLIVSLVVFAISSAPEQTSAGGRHGFLRRNA